MRKKNTKRGCLRDEISLYLYLSLTHKVGSMLCLLKKVVRSSSVEIGEVKTILASTTKLRERGMPALAIEGLPMCEIS